MAKFPPLMLLQFPGAGVGHLPEIPTYRHFPGGILTLGVIFVREFRYCGGWLGGYGHAGGDLLDWADCQLSLWDFLIQGGQRHGLNHARGDPRNQSGLLHLHSIPRCCHRNGRWAWEHYGNHHNSDGNHALYHGQP